MSRTLLTQPKISQICHKVHTLSLFPVVNKFGTSEVVLNLFKNKVDNSDRLD